MTRLSIYEKIKKARLSYNNNVIIALIKNNLAFLYFSILRKLGFLQGRKKSEVNKLT